jgi:hypothetical protein
MAFGPVPGWGWRACADATLGEAPAMIRRLIIDLPAHRGRGHGRMGAGAQASELASAARRLYGLAPS